MSAPFDPRIAAARFWARAGVTEPFPRRLTPTIAAILPVAVILLPKLSIASMSDWLSRRGARCPALVGSRRLRGCLVAQRGHGFIFVDGSLGDDEQRLTVAHETAHFLHHYEGPRLAALTLLGPSIGPVLDGDRRATASEELRGALREVPLGVYSHALDRSASGLPSEETAQLETEADLIGFELLAPMAAIRASARKDAYPRALTAQFGLPPWAAARWGAWIASREGGDGFIARLKAARGAERALSNSGSLTGSSQKKSLLKPPP